MPLFLASLPRGQVSLGEVEDQASRWQEDGDGHPGATG